jgi:uncharacterized protein (TIGR03435 family)
MSTHSRTIALLLSAVALTTTVVDAPSCAQATASQTPVTAPVYDVVSVKIDKTARNSSGIDVSGDTFHAGNVSLKELLARVYGIRPELIFGIRDPLDSVRFDVDAKIVDPDPNALKKLTAEQRAAMLGPVLADRFAVKAHIETKTLPTFDLVAIGSGAKLQTSPSDKAARDGSISVYNTKLIARGLTIEKLAGTLTDIVHRKVIDKTDLTGQYDFTLRWSVDEVTRAEDGTGIPTEGPPVIFTALEDQLGLKLLPSKGLVDVLVIDHAEMPSEN